MDSEPPSSKPLGNVPPWRDFNLSTFSDSAHQNIGDLFSNKRQRPSENVFVVRQMVRMWREVELTDVHSVAPVLQNGTFVFIRVGVVWSREQSQQSWEPSGIGLTIHSVPGILHFMRSDHRQQIVSLQERRNSLERVGIRTTSQVVWSESCTVQFLVIVLQRIRPKQITKQTSCWRFPESIDSVDVVRRL
ncbi:hypothetical protein WICPIJ_005320 [Wickerhamomyces pijperi]|uniref:Uncharacterized protein n=1 Tax=Wickerhamomyces pijperi TaxID=599730 RepID=A0A9P8TLY0_WICPI|nr:hypothetical protein WICPIJ_005320 [Wickerhamomyces pijperi]